MTIDPDGTVTEVDANLVERLELMSANALDERDRSALEIELARRPDGERLLAMFAPLTELESRRVRTAVRPKRRPAKAPVASIAIAAGLVAAGVAGLLLARDTPARLELESSGATVFAAHDEVRVRLAPSGAFEELAYFTVDDTRTPRHVRWLDLDRGQLEVRQQAFGFTGERYGRSEVLFVGGRRGCVGAWTTSGAASEDCAVARLEVDVLPPRMAVTVSEIGEALMGGSESEATRRVVVTPNARLAVRALAFDPELSRRGYDGLDVELEYRRGEAWISLGAPSATWSWTLDAERLFADDRCVVPLRILVRATTTETIDIELVSRMCETKGGK